MSTWPTRPCAIGPAPAAQSYLDIDKIIAAAKETGAEAIHPGYGFLSENAAFARALEKAGIVFVGPNVHAIEAMGDKIEFEEACGQGQGLDRAGPSRRHQGRQGGGQDRRRDRLSGHDQGLAPAAAARACASPIAAKEVDEGFASSKCEAKSSFGDDRVFIEKYIEEPRHIEIQVLGDKHGNVIHLGERECSIQRRNQKVIEEAPSPFLDAKTREAMGAQAVALAKAVGYDSAGTVEFIVDKDRNFYFLEMNTRLQVEHPVTELVTGLDLVEQMMQIGGRREARPQAEGRQAQGLRDRSPHLCRGSRCAISCRRPGGSCAIVRREIGTEGGVTTRLDSGVEEGGEISVYYDPMIAKLVTHAPKRLEAIEQMGTALDAFAIDGFRHNIPFLAVLMRNERWRRGGSRPSSSPRNFPKASARRAPRARYATCWSRSRPCIDHLSNQRRRVITQQMHGEQVRFAETRIVELGEERVRVTVEGGVDGPMTVTLGGKGTGEKERRIELSSPWWFGEPVWEGTIDGKPVAVQVRPILNGAKLTYQGRRGADAGVHRARDRAHGAMPVKVKPDMSKFLLCPMPGLVVSLAVAEGQEVAAGDALCVVEAMKMENVLKAERDGKVSKILAKPGDSLNVDAVILEFA